MGKDCWLPGPDTSVLGEKEIHVWRANLDCSPADRERFRAHLSPDERQRAAAFYFEQHRNHYITARGILRELLSRYLQRPASEFRFSYTAFGKPSLESPVHFNVSHSDALALFAFARTDVGVDVEHFRPELAGQEIANRFFAPSEAFTLQSLPSEKRLEGFFRCWTRKEAFIKAHGKGLSLPLNKFTVDFSDCARLLSTAFDPAELDRWSLYGLEPGPGYAGAVAAQGTDHDLKLFDFTNPTPSSSV